MKNFKSRLDRIEKLIPLRQQQPEIIMHINFVSAKDGRPAGTEKPATLGIRQQVEKDIAEQRAAGKKVVMALVPVGYHL